MTCTDRVATTHALAPLDAHWVQCVRWHAHSTPRWVVGPRAGWLEACKLVWPVRTTAIGLCVGVTLPKRVLTTARSLAPAPIRTCDRLADTVASSPMRRSVTPHTPRHTRPRSEYDRRVRQSGPQGATRVADVSVSRPRSCDGSWNSSATSARGG